jgi:hypothetical protein
VHAAEDLGEELAGEVSRVAGQGLAFAGGFFLR